MISYTISYAQNREDIILSGFFKNIEKGFYVDVGANHPELDSVTKIFYDKGWSGINIEPIKSLYEKLLSERPRDINLNIGISDKETTLNFRQYSKGVGLSTFSKEMQEEYQLKTDFTTDKHIDYSVKLFPLRSVFKDNNVGEINFLKIDVEGYEYEVLKSNDWDKFRPQVVCIEANHVKEDWKQILTNNNYLLVFFDGLNEYYVDKKQQFKLSNFSYIDTVLPQPIVPFKLHSAIKKLTDKLTREEQISSHLRAQLNEANYELSRSKRVRSLAKKLVLAVDASILVHLNNLNKQKTRSTRPILLTKEDTFLDALAKVKAYDLEQYYSTNSEKRVIFQLAYGLYTFVSRTIFKLGRFSWITLRKTSVIKQ